MRRRTGWRTPGPGRVAELQVQDVAGHRIRGRGETAGVRSGDPDQADIAGRGRPGGRCLAAAATDIAEVGVRRVGGGDRGPGDRVRPAVQGDPVADAGAQHVGEGPLEHHAAGPHPAARRQLRLVNRRQRLGPPFRLGRRRAAVYPHDGPDERIGPAMAGHPGSARQRRRGLGGRCRQLAGLVLDWQIGHHVRPVRRRPGLLIRLARHPVQDQPQREDGGGSGDRQQQQQGLGPAVPQVAAGQA